MEKRTDLYGNNDMEGIKAMEKELLAQKPLWTWPVTRAAFKAQSL